MRDTIYGIMPKSPWPQGRIGSEFMQDWYAQCTEAAEQVRKHKHRGIEIVVSSETHVKGAEREDRYYRDALGHLGVIPTLLCKGTETESHICALGEYAATREADLVIIVTKAHYWRVRWICWRQGVKASLIKVAGWARPSELRSDWVLTFLYPIIDLCGLKGRFLQLVRTRRDSGKL